MNDVVNEKVSVIFVHDRANGFVMPVRMKWQGKEYKLEKLGYYHKYRQGIVTIHVFSVSNNDLAFRLECRSDDLSWTLMEVSDGLAS